ncbi:MAG: hypothetical protein V1673_00375 [Candidatus Omnitrophota bacterium]
MRKIFIVVAGGNLAAERHFEDTIQRKRSLEEVRKFLPEQEIKNLQDIYHNSPFIVWGAVPGQSNQRNWENMAAGDVVLIYNGGRIRAVGEVAAKVHSRDLARYFWQEKEGGTTWEFIYFIVNDERINVPFNKLNVLFGYKENYFPRGFSMVNEEAVKNFFSRYGDILGVLKTLEKGEELVNIAPQAKSIKEKEEEFIAQAPTEHTEMQWRLIRLGRLARCDVWVPRNDQGREFEGHTFRELVLPEFHETLDVPPSIKNIDVVWKFGPYSIKSAFEVENSTQIYSGILRLSDLRAENPNSNYPLFIVASETRRTKVFNELRRPTFSGPCLRLNEVIRFLGYEKIREIDESNKNSLDFDPNVLLSVGESVNPATVLN